MTDLIKRFNEELLLFQKRNGYSSIAKMVSECLAKQGYEERAIYRIKSGEKKLDEIDWENFSKLFNVRKEYLTGKDDYRTEEDKRNAERQERNIRTAFHHFLVSMGYADLDMDQIDYNQTFPMNTRVFLESVKEDLIKENVSLICDVNNDEFITIHNSMYDQLIAEIADFVDFKLSQYFSTNALPVFTPICDDGTTYLHPRTVIPLKDGDAIEVVTRYTQTGEMTDDTVKKMIAIDTVKK